jgi:hypothetical protein
MAETKFKSISLNPLVPVDYDRVDLSDYTDGNPGTVEYYKDGVVVCTLTLTYSGDDLTSVVRS